MKLFKSPLVWLEAFLVCCLIFFWGFSASKSDINSSSSFDSVKQALQADLDPALYPDQNDQGIRRMLNIDPSMAEQIWFARDNDLMSADEIVLVKFSPDQKDALENALIARKDSQEQTYEGYAPEQLAQVQNGLIDFQANYGLLYIGDNPEHMDELFLKALGGK